MLPKGCVCVCLGECVRLHARVRLIRENPTTESQATLIQGLSEKCISEHCHWRCVWGKRVRGNGDQGKRAKMAAVCSALSPRSIIGSGYCLSILLSHSLPRYPFLSPSAHALQCMSCLPYLLIPSHYALPLPCFMWGMRCLLCSTL